MVRRVSDALAADLFAAVESPSGERALYLEVDAKSIPHGTTLPRAHGIEVTSHRLQSGRVRLAAKLIDRRAADVFTVLVDDVVAEVATATSEQGCVEQALRRIRHWQEFLQKHGLEGLTAEQQLGLFGEVSFLKDQLLQRLDPDVAVGSWVGPTGANQDFQLPGSAFEVKSSIAAPHLRIRISNIRQLDDTGVGTLILTHLVLDSRLGGAGGVSLRGVVDELRERLRSRSDSALSMFESRLQTCGYLDVHADRYDVVRYTPRSMSHFHVREGFPRLLEGELPNGIGDVTYSIQVAICRAFEMTEEQVDIFLVGSRDGR